MIKAVVGSGGKTTLIRKYVRMYRQKGYKVFVTTSTHMFRDKDTLVTDDASEIIRELERNRYVMAGRMADTKSGRMQKITALPTKVYEEVCRHADVVLVEADGSRQMPVKFPGIHEPVIYDNIEEIIVVCGLWALHENVKNAAHRPELVMRCLQVSENTPIEAIHIQKLVQKGYVEPLREKYPEKTVTVMAAHNGTLYQRAAAALLKAEIDVSLLREEWFSPQPHLFICGGGHISCELVKMASCLDFHIQVMDDREEFAHQERFPLADRVICDSFAHLERYLEPEGYYVVVTRGHQADYECVSTILDHSYRYLGMIGSRAKVRNTLEKLREAGMTQEQIQSIHAPVGLPIKAVTPAEIAVSILAEIIMEKNSRGTGSASRELLETKESGTLCIITKKSGSSPRGVGSMMFVKDSEVIGTIGGGAVEYEAIREARSHSGVRLREYDLGSEEAGNLGMICGGRNQVLFIPLDDSPGGDSL